MSDKWKKLLRIKLAPWFGVILFSLLQLWSRLKVEGIKCISRMSKFVKSSLAKSLLFKNVLKLFFSKSLASTHWIKSRMISSSLLLYNFVKLFTHHILLYFARRYKESFKRPTGIAFVCGLEYMEILSEAVKQLITNYPIQYAIVSISFQALKNTEQEFTPLFFKNLTQKEKELLEKIRVIHSQKKNGDLNNLLDLVRVYLGETWLLKKTLEEKKEFMILGYVLHPKECEYLRSKGYKLVYLSGKDYMYLTRYCKGYTYGCFNFDKYFFEKERITVEELKSYIEKEYTQD